MRATSEAPHRTIEMAIDSVTLTGDLTIPMGTTSLVIFAHGSGSSRLSPRNRFVASVLQHNNMATLLFDLLTPEEDTNYQMRFNIELLTGRLENVILWALSQPDLSILPIGCFGASTGAAAALGVAADLPDDVKAVVSRGGRPDLTVRDLALIKAPTLLIVGGHDDLVMQLNQKVFSAMKTTGKKLYIVPGATHLFEEPGALEEVARVASDWFKLHLARAR
jgi:putative phosphoribosyl transferase